MLTHDEHNQINYIMDNFAFSTVYKYLKEHADRYTYINDYVHECQLRTHVRKNLERLFTDKLRFIISGGFFYMKDDYSLRVIFSLEDWAYNYNDE